MSYERRSYGGGAVTARLNANISDTDTSLVLQASPGYAGWPTGASGPFYVAIDRGEATDGHSEEKIMVASRSGATLTLTGVGSRGLDGTTAAAHTAGVTVEHVGTAADFDEANAHITDVTRNDHTQYMRKSQNLADLTNTTTARTNLGAQASDADLTAIAALVSAANKLPYATGAGTWALADLTAFARTFLDDADAATVRATLGILSMAIQAANAVNITGGTVTGITDLAVADGGTGASTAANARTNLGLGTLATKSTVTNTELDQSAWTTYTPTNDGITVGNGTQSAAYKLNGKQCVVRYSLTLGSTSSLTGTTIGPAFGLPFAATANQVGTMFTKNHGGTSKSGTANVLTASSAVLAQFNDADGVGWSATSPWSWTTGDIIVAQITYETT